MEGSSFVRVKIEHKRRLINLHPVGPSEFQLLRELLVDGQQPRQERHGIETLVGRLRQLQEGHGSKDDRACMDAELFCLQK
ncbi:hypothetical protein BAE40_13520 [Mesorhizobium loti]|nr:hypothetical protein BAE40_13520 [Mesorhizobium loti]